MANRSPLVQVGAGSTHSAQKGWDPLILLGLADPVPHLNEHGNPSFHQEDFGSYPQAQCCGVEV